MSAYPVPPHTTSPPTILLVDDDPPVRQVLKLALCYLGFAVTACPDVASALASLQLSLPSVILTDCNLPDQTGIDLIEAIRGMHQHLPIIGMSGEHFKGEAMLQAGAKMFLPKPVEIAHLQEALAHIRLG